MTLVSVSALAGVPAWVRAACGERVLREANRAALLDMERIENLDCFIPHLSMANFIDTIARRSGLTDLGLMLASELPIANYGIWGRYVLGAENLGDAVRRAQRSIGYHSKGDQVSLVLANGMARLSYVSAARGFPGYAHVAVATIGVMLSLCEAYLPPPWRPHRIELDIARPVDGRDLADCFHCPVMFDAPDLALVFDHRALDRHRTVVPAWSPTTIEDVARARQEPGLREGAEGVIRAQIRTQVLAGSASVERTARALDMSVRSLQRELNAAGVSYRGVVGKLRNERAIELLRDGAMPVAAVAALLGYSSSAHLARAFRRENGVPPRQFRPLR